jgi:hypothetical protein
MDWQEWVNAESLPMGERLVFEVTCSYAPGGKDYQLGQATMIDNGRQQIAKIAGRFHWDYTILRWAIITHILPYPPGP